LSTLLRSSKKVWSTSSPKLAVISFCSKDNYIKCTRSATEVSGSTNSSHLMLKDATSNGYTKQTKTLFRKWVTLTTLTSLLTLVPSKAKFSKWKHLILKDLGVLLPSD
jgi:hypothetical protein